MNAERLLKLASFLKTVPPERFDYGIWASHGALEWKPEEKVRLSCGTTACAGGWATAIPEFAALGLKMSHYYSPTFEGQEDFDAMELFFELSTPEAVHLFSPCGEDDATPIYVAEKIEKFVAERANATR